MRHLVLQAIFAAQTHSLANLLLILAQCLTRLATGHPFKNITGHLEHGMFPSCILVSIIIPGCTLPFNVVSVISFGLLTHEVSTALDEN
jgi:hypothetical protein